jgi:polyhydroxybutyrate depolymerase
MHLSLTSLQSMPKTVLKLRTCLITYSSCFHPSIPDSLSSKQKCRHTIPHLLSSTVVLCCFLLNGCGLFIISPPSRQISLPSPVPISSRPIDHPVGTKGCGKLSPVASGSSSDQTFAVNPADSLGYRTRSYRVHVPVAYKSNLPTALVLYFHGYGGTALLSDRISGFTPFSEKHNFIVAYGQGLPEGEGGAPFWASAGPIDYGIDDIHYVSLMLDDLQSKLCIDARRIFVTGFSNGGGMSGYLACSLAGRIAAVAPVSGNFYALPGGCHPVRSMPLLDVHGTADLLLPYQGISSALDPPWPLPSIPQWLQEWSVRDGCLHGPMIFLRSAQELGEQWTKCQENVEVVHYRIIGGGHSWPRLLGNRPSLILSFSRHSYVKWNAYSL